MAEEFGISRNKVRKILITTGDVVSPRTRRIEEMLTEGKTIKETSAKMGISISSVNSLLPYSKGVYGLNVSAAADRTQLYRARKQIIEELKEEMDAVTLWKAVCLFQGYPFTTAGRKTKDGVKGQEKFRYEVSAPGGPVGRRYEGSDVEGFGNEMFIINSTGEKRDKGISRSSVDYAFSVVQEKNGVVTGPKALKIYGSSYVYALFVRFGLIGAGD